MTHEDMQDMLARIETRIVRGFTKLGVDPCARAAVVLDRIDETDKVVYVRNRDVTLEQVFKRIAQTVHDPYSYSIKYTGENYV